MESQCFRLGEGRVIKGKFIVKKIVYDCKGNCFYKYYLINRNLQLQSYYQMKNQSISQNSCTHETDSYQFKITLQKEQQKFIIHLWLHYKQNFDIYQLRMNQNYLRYSQMKELMVLFPSPCTIFEQMKEIIKEIKILKGGTIKFDIGIGRSGSKEIRIQLVKIEVEKMQFLLNKINQMRAEYAQQIAKIRHEYNQYMFEMKKEYTDEIKHLKQELHTLRDEVKTLQQPRLLRIAPIKSEASHHSDIKTEEASNTVEIEYKQALSLNHQTQGTEIFDSQSPIVPAYSQPKKKIQNLNGHILCPLRTSSHYKFFKANRKDQSSVVVRKLGNEGFYNFIPQLIIRPSKKIRIKMILQKTKQSYVMLGIGLKSILGTLDAYHKNSCLAYFCNNGQIYENGQGIGKGPIVKDRQIIIMNVDTIKYTVEWVVKEQGLKLKIPPHLTGQQLFVMVMMAHADDSVELSILE